MHVCRVCKMLIIAQWWKMILFAFVCLIVCWILVLFSTVFSGRLQKWIQIQTVQHHWETFWGTRTNTWENRPVERKRNLTPVAQRSRISGPTLVPDYTDKYVSGSGCHWQQQWCAIHSPSPNGCRHDWNSTIPIRIMPHYSAEYE